MRSLAWIFLALPFAACATPFAPVSATTPALTDPAPAGVSSVDPTIRPASSVPMLAKPLPITPPQTQIGFGAGTATTQTAVLPSFSKPWTTPYYAKSGDDIDCRGGSLVSATNTTIVITNVHDVRVHNCKLSSTLTQLPPARIGVATISTCAHPVKPVDVFGCGVPVLVWGAARNVYIDHNDFSRCGEKCVAIGTQELAKPLPDGTVPAPDNVTVAFNKFSNSYFGMAVMAQKGIGAGALPHPMHVTFAYNLCDGVYRRCVRAQSASAMVDETGNVIRNWTWPGNIGCDQFKGFGPSSLGGAQLLLRNNVIDAKGSCPTATDVSDYIATDETDRGVGFIKADGDLLLHGALEFQNTPTSVVFTPPAYPMLPAAQVAAYVLKNAGVQ